MIATRNDVLGIRAGCGMTEENIDKSCWLSRGESVLTPEREKMGGFALSAKDNGEVLEIQLTVKNILNYLHEQEVISDQNLYDAYTFQIWQMIWKAAHGLERSNADIPRNDNKERFKELGYGMILRRISRDELAVIEFSINTFSTDHTRFIAENRKQIYRAALERLSEVLPAIRDKIEALEANKEESEIL